jgi:ClpP class serine protease
VRVHAFVEDVAASGGYWLACAGDDIWVDSSSIVGSIGVIFAGFGFPEVMARQGIERRVHHRRYLKELCRSLPAGNRG